MKLVMFHYPEIDRSRRMLRLWRFQQPENDSPRGPRLVLRTFDHTDCPPYIALSYVWGDMHSNSRVIRVNYGHLRVSGNLYDFISHLSSVLPDSEQWFWCDQVSMNQADDLERNHQVGLMGKIYAEAREVYSWLGCLDQIGASRDQNQILLHMLTHDYWDRLWIVQELYFAQSIILWCGNASIDLQQLQARFEQRDLINVWAETHVGSLRDSKQRDRAFSPAHWQKVQLLLRLGHGQADMDSGPWPRTLDLVTVIELYAGNECSDPRDKLFGLQSLVHREQRLEVDYRSSFDIVACTLFMKLILQMGHRQRCAIFRKILDRHGGVSEIGELKTIDKIRSHLGAPEEWIRQIVWKHVMARVFKLLTDTIKQDVNRDVKPESETGFLNLQGWSDVWMALKDFAVTAKEKAFAESLNSETHDFAARQRRLWLEADIQKLEASTTNGLYVGVYYYDTILLGSRRTTKLPLTLSEYGTSTLRRELEEFMQPMFVRAAREQNFRLVPSDSSEHDLLVSPSHSPTNGGHIANPTS